MRLSCLPRSLFPAISRGELALADWFRFAAELGLDGVECSPVFLPPLGPILPGEFRRRAEAHGLVVSNYTSYSDFTRPDPVARQEEVRAMIENAKAAKEMGSPTVRALAGQRRSDVGRAEGITWVVEAIRQVAEAADRLGVRVVIENHTKAFTWDDVDFSMHGDVLLEILEGLRDTSVGVQFDTGNPLVAEEDPLDLFEQVKDRIAAIHLSDPARVGVFAFVPLGTGVAPIPEILARLNRCGYTGWIGIEEASDAGLDAYRTAVAFVRNELTRNSPSGTPFAAS